MVPYHSEVIALLFYRSQGALFFRFAFSSVVGQKSSVGHPLLYHFCITFNKITFFVSIYLDSKIYNIGIL